jgi:purine-cytosine permease-like protein
MALTELGYVLRRLCERGRAGWIVLRIWLGVVVCSGRGLVGVLPVPWGGLGWWRSFFVSGFEAILEVF